MAGDIRSSPSLDGAAASLPVGALLARMRRRLRLSGVELGRRVAMSQAKISKIETGAVVASAADVERIARALGASGDEARALADRAESAHDQLTDWRMREGGLAAGQREVAAVEAATTTFRVFALGMLGGLLQTTGYARAVLTSVVDLRTRGGAAEPVAEAVSARVKRQEVLSDPDRRFTFLMTESALANLLCPPVEMAAQIERLREVGGQHNVTLAVLPATTRLAYPPLHSFAVFDDRMVLVDVINTFLTSRGRADLDQYLRVFEALEAQAVTDVRPFLDRYQQHFLRLSRRHLGG